MASSSEPNFTLELLLLLSFVFSPRSASVYWPTTSPLGFKHFLITFYPRLQNLESVLLIISRCFHSLAKLVQMFDCDILRQSWSRVPPDPHNLLHQSRPLHLGRHSRHFHHEKGVGHGLPIVLIPHLVLFHPHLSVQQRHLLVHIIGRAIPGERDHRRDAAPGATSVDMTEHL